MFNFFIFELQFYCNQNVMAYLWVIHVRRRQNPKVRMIEKLDTVMTVVVRVEGAREWGVIVRRNRGRCRVGHRVSCRCKRRASYRVNMCVTSKEPALKYSNSGIPVHLEINQIAVARWESLCMWEGK